jgi:S-adenosylmethionine decarboxylase proenzyme
MKVSAGVYKKYDDKIVLGKHVLIELHGVDSGLLDDLDKVKRILSESAVKGSVTVEGTLGHRFEPQGVSVILLLSESHISIHTWPEIGFAAVDIFTCGGKPEAITENIISEFKPKVSKVDYLDRGVIHNSDD